MIFLLVESSASLVLSTVFVVLLRWLSVPLRLIDLPDHRKIHEGAVPLCGGIAIFMAFSGMNLLTANGMDVGPGFWLATILVVTLGVLDDRFTLPARFRFAAQVMIAVALIAAESLGQMSFGDILPVAGPGAYVVLLVISVGFVVGLINAWNMADGVDGLAGGMAASTLVWILVLVLQTGEDGLIFPVAALLAAVGGFLVFNLRSPWRARASVYLGDAGSTGLGAIIAYLILRLSDGAQGLPFPSLLWLVIVPVIDTLSLMVRRLLDHRSPMSADRRHLHHLMIDSGLSQAATSYIIILVSFLCGGIGYLGLLFEVPQQVMVAGLLLVTVVHSAFVLTVETATHRRANRAASPSIKLQI
ncbi:MraY family glycosyltransferase [Shinella sp.]|uniref:MraY family glycosyltransferase n=1 Tax=Shinella sp. TaxID=1870904 RepID=UPI0028AD146D|nr:MraY family glycosyltransferase [Shinella sp.]